VPDPPEIPIRSGSLANVQDYDGAVQVLGLLGRLKDRFRRLKVIFADYEDGSFNGAYSAGSIGHFGTLDEIRRSAAEIHRVLKPGGVLALTTEFRIEGPGHGWPGLIFFTPELVSEYLVGPSPLVGPSRLGRLHSLRCHPAGGGLSG
jgi:hypothetical protein